MANLNMPQVKLNEIRHAMAILKAHGDLDEMFAENEDAILVEQFTQHPDHCLIISLARLIPSLL